MTSQTDTVKDAKNDFCLHPSANFGVILVSSLLSGENYSMCSTSIIKVLSAKNKYGFINRLIINPPTTNPNYGLWKQYDYTVASWNIVNPINKKLAKDVIYVGITKYL